MNLWLKTTLDHSLLRKDSESGSSHFCKNISSTCAKKDRFFFFTSLSMLQIKQLIKHGFKASGQRQMGKQDVKVRLFFVFFNAFISAESEAAKTALVLPPPSPPAPVHSPPLPGSCHGAVPSQLAAPLAGVASEDYERHYKV